MADNLSIIEPDTFYGNSDDVADTGESVTDENITENPEETPVEEVEENQETDESEKQEDNEEETKDEVEELYIELDGEEVSLEQVKKWKSEGLMQADYTRKTQLLADDRKLLETDTSNLSTALEDVKVLTAELEALIGVENDVNMDELREDDPEEYIVQKERKEKREKLLAKSKESLSTTTGISKEEAAAEQAKLSKNHPEWFDDSKTTKVYDSDMKALDDYLKANDWGKDDFAGVTQSKHMEALIKAAKFDALKSKTKTISEKRKKAPVIKKGQSKSSEKAESKKIEDIFYKN